jgi:cytochrome c oxidase cbb3-type subunit 3
MKSWPNLSKSAIVLAGLLFFGAYNGLSQGTVPKARTNARSAKSWSGQSIFASNCIGCHGLDGTGTQRAPNIVTNPRVQKLSAAQMFSVVSQGLPGTGMPGFHRLGSAAISTVVEYVIGLQGRDGSATVAGDPRQGETIFFGKGECSSCHMVAGKGGFIGPDLTGYTQTHKVDKVKAAIINSAERDSIGHMATVVTSDGQQCEGIVRNEDNFSVQLQSRDGTFCLISKANLKSIERRPGSIMPSDYSSRLSKSELDDVVAFLLRVGS